MLFTNILNSYQRIFHAAVSVYRKKDKAMIAIDNWTSDEQTISLSIDCKRPGMDLEAAITKRPNIDDLQEAGEIDMDRLHLPVSKGIILIIESNE